MKFFYVFTLLLAANLATAQNHGSDCGPGLAECDTAQHLVCQHPFDIVDLVGNCVCKPGTERYGNVPNTCRAVLGEPCSAGLSCTDNAVCSTTTSRCECLPNFLETVTGSKRCRATFGTTCATTTGNQCNEDSRLQCLTQTAPLPSPICKCSNTGGYTEWMADPRSKCVSKVGATCNADLSLADDEECIPNAACSGTTCQCVTGYSRTHDDKCALNLGEICGTGLACNTDVGFACIAGKCECNTTTHVSPSPGMCRRKARQPCNPNRNDCLSNRCEISLTPSICLCPNGQVELEDGTCGTLGEYCYVDADCDEHRFEKCDRNFAGTPNAKYGKCVCTQGVDQNGKCVNKAGSDCKKYQNCVENAECIGGQCECKDGYLQSSDNFCRPSVGRTCNILNPCEAGLICDNTCSCPIGQEWLQTEGQPDSWKGHCVAFVGGNCTTTSPYCTKNAVCTDAGVCECKTGFSHTYYDNSGNLDPAERRCLRTHNETCSETDRCNPGDFLTCSAGKCECLYGSQQVYDPASKKCKGLSGAFCGRIIEENTGRNASCVPNAECVPDTQGIYKCKCFGSNVAAGKDCTEGTDSGASSLVIMSVFTLVGFSKIVTSMFN